MTGRFVHYIRLCGDVWLAETAGPGESIPDDVRPDHLFAFWKSAELCARLQNEIDRVRAERAERRKGAA